MLEKNNYVDNHLDMKKTPLVSEISSNGVMTSTYIAFAGKVHSSSLLCNMQMCRMWRCTLPVWRKQLRKKKEE